MKSKLIAMLTYHDQTVSNALEIFDQNKELPVECWGFKNVGLPVEKMKTLVANMKKTHKVTFLEVVTYTEASCLSAAQLALECQFDYLMGTVYYDSVHRLLKKHPLKYFPFCGQVSGSPSILEGSIEEIIQEAQELVGKQVDGFDLLGYRYISGDPEALISAFLSQIKIPTVLAGTIQSIERLDKVKKFNPWGFTIGGAFFDKKFFPEGSYQDQIKSVLSYLK